MPPALLQSQIDTFEPPMPSDGAINLEMTVPLASLITAKITKLRADQT